MKPQSKQILGHNNYYNAKLHFRHRRVLSVSDINEQSNTENFHQRHEDACTSVIAPQMIIH